MPRRKATGAGASTGVSTGARMGSGTGIGTDARRLMTRVGIGAGVVALLVFALQGGEYDTAAIYSQRSRHTRLKAAVDSMRTEVDSLTRELHSIRTDDARLEQIARERYGMIRGERELLYMMVVDSAAANAEARERAQRAARMP